MKDIIKEFNKKFGQNWGKGGLLTIQEGSELETFISQTISQTRQELLTELEEKLPKEKEERTNSITARNINGFNSCLKQIRSIIDSKK